MSDRNAAVGLKLTKAKGLLSEVDVLIQHRFYLTAINRLYYSCFHATKALLLTKNLIPKTHSGVVAMLHRHFVQEGTFDIGQASFFSRLMQERIEDDYNDFLIVDEVTVNEFNQFGKKYVDYIEQLIKEQFSNQV